MSLRNTKVKLQFLLFSLLFIFLSILKFHEYDRTPGTNHAEELLYGWAGIHLIETGVPLSWSTLDYPKEYLVFDGIVGEGASLTLPAKLYKPWLDEPPLYTLLSGGAAHLYGDDRDQVLPTSHTRIPSIIASIVTMALIFWVGYKFFGYKIGILSMLFYGITPVFVFGSRLSVPENIIALAVVLSIYLGKKYLDQPKMSLALVFGLMSAVLGLMKPTGFFLAPLLMFLAIKRNRWRDVGLILGVALIGVLLFIAYGYYFDWELFKQIVSIQGNRFSGWTGLAYTLVSPAYDIFLFFDGWYIFSLIASLYFVIKKKKSAEISLLALFWLYWLLIVVFSGTEQDLLPWYRYPMFPIMAIFGALGIREVWRQADFYTTSLAIGLVLTSRFYLHNAFRPTTPPMVFRAVFLLAVLPSLIGLVWSKMVYKKITRTILIIFFLLGVYFNAKLIYSNFPIACESISCPIGPSTRLSKIRLPFFWRFLVPEDSTGMLDEKRPWF